MIGFVTLFETGDLIRADRIIGLQVMPATDRHPDRVLVHLDFGSPWVVPCADPDHARSVRDYIGRKVEGSGLPRPT